jgi:hypothetical protein
MRSPTMLRWICDVPAAIEIEIAWSHPHVPGRPARPRGRRALSPASPSSSMARSPSSVANLGVGQLEHRPADAGHAVAPRLGDVALGQRPQGVELGGEVAELGGGPGVLPGAARPVRQVAAELGEVAEQHRDWIISDTNAVPRSNDR